MKGKQKEGPQARQLGPLWLLTGQPRDLTGLVQQDRCSQPNHCCRVRHRHSLQHSRPLPLAKNQTRLSGRRCSWHLELLVLQLHAARCAEQQGSRGTRAVSRQHWALRQRDAGRLRNRRGEEAPDSALHAWIWQLSLQCGLRCAQCSLSAGEPQGRPILHGNQRPTVSLRLEWHLGVRCFA